MAAIDAGVRHTTKNREIVAEVFEHIKVGSWLIILARPFRKEVLRDDAEVRLDGDHAAGMPAAASLTLAEAKAGTMASSQGNETATPAPRRNDRRDRERPGMVLTSRNIQYSGTWNTRGVV